MNWPKMTPESVNRLMNFKSKDSDWTYSANDRSSMEAKQTEGVAYLWNLLGEHGVALLADEVGTGKTFQALGVAALLWRQKPEARVLVVAPNKNLCTQWRKEYETFVRLIYKEIDHKVKSCVSDKPVQGMEVVDSLGSLVERLRHSTAHLYFMTIHAFSRLTTGKTECTDTGASAAELAKEEAAKMHRDIKKTAVCANGFDLVIFDEAHYLRNKGGGSQRAAAVEAFLQQDNSRLAQHALLLTATPNHTNSTDIYNVLSYFKTPEEQPSDVEKLMKTYGLRRLRVLSAVQDDNHRHFGKYHYRNELALEANFEQNPEAEAFFAIYQKRLVQDLLHKKDKKHLTYGYLEGFESVGYRDDESEKNGREPPTSHDDTGKEEGKDSFSRARDTELLQELTKRYFNAVNSLPVHPKYKTLVDQCVPDLTKLREITALEQVKHLVFVRRIPSSRELAQRMNRRYDKQLAKLMLEGWQDDMLEQLDAGHYSRDVFNQFVSPTEEREKPITDSPIDDNGEIDETKHASSQGSAVAQLFVVKRDESQQTDAAHVKLRFIRDESVFSLFFEPAANYLRADYTCYKHNGERSYYKSAAKNWRFEHSANAELRAEAKDVSLKDFDKSATTCWAMVYPYLSGDEQQLLGKWAKEQPKVAENFANYIRTGFLYVSPVFLEVYAWYKAFSSCQEMTKVSAEKRYRAFCCFVKPKLKSSLLLKYFKTALNSFEMLCNKIVDHKLDDWKQEWNQLKRLTAPVAFASGDTDSSTREGLKLGFNSPFYPHVLVATSVFKEGVNLHLNCHQIHHYGLAGSAGDNEQRIGRVDRMYGSIHRRLSSSNAELNVYYPYLANSIDEDQLASFVKRKHSVESQLDRCLQDNSSEEISYEDQGDWQRTLNTPEKLDNKAEQEDPYPACFAGIDEPQHYDVSETKGPSLAALKKHVRAFLPGMEKNNNLSDSESSWAFHFERTVPATLRTNGTAQRYQPIFVKIDFSPEFSAVVPDTAYIVRLASPIATKEQLRSITQEQRDEYFLYVSELTKKYPLVRTILNEQAELSHFYISTVVEFPLFANDDKLSLLSEKEIIVGIQQLEAFADELEHTMFSIDRDLRESDVEIGASLRQGGLILPSGRAADTDAVTSKAVWEQGPVEILQKQISVDLLKNMLVRTNLAAPELALHYNSLFPFINFISCADDSASLTAQVAFPSDGFDAEERSVLERWLAAVVG